ncbi:exonuclease mut-7 homolog [Cydia strobilella]|uniref:exonuclease mut-7 homolog n=1 Tax=Cydia strobilella TaxID=1100964 RepID=UPI003005DB91
MDINQLVSKNQSIKIVPSIEETLQNQGLDVDLDDITILWLRQLKETWKTWKRSPTIEHHIELFFNSRADAFRVALVFVIKCEDSKDCKTKTLPYFIIEILHKWSRADNLVPEDCLKLPAFHIAIRQRNQSFLSLMAKTYQLSTMKETILPIVRSMITNDNCKQACQVVIALELFDDISVQELLFPLILQDKSNIIDEYLSECPAQVAPLLQFLDMLLDKNFSIREYVQNYIEEHNICNIKYDKIHYKPLGKLVARLCNKFKVPIETCKNLSKNRTTGGLRYLIHQKYEENNLSTAVWDDLIKDSLRQNTDSAHEFIDMLVAYDKNEALKWASYLNLQENLLPAVLREMTIQSDEAEPENWDTDVKSETTHQEYYKFTLPLEQIIMIDTAEKFYDLMVNDLAGCSLVSIDCEWKPSFGAKQSQVGLIQIATDRNVYLIDSIILNQKQYSSFWHTFYKSLLDNAEIVKIGFGLEQDLREMKASIIGLNNMKLKGEGLLDICILWKNLISCGLVLPSNSDSAGNSLSSLVQSCFGLPLQKSEQCSNWELRPLRDTQIQYAALDAHVLIQIYYFLQQKCLEQRIDFDEICNEVTLERKKKCSKKFKVVEKTQIFVPLKSVNDVKLFIEPELSNLMTYLRYCGIDTMLIPPTLLWHDVINLAISEDRLVVTAKYKCTPFEEFPQSCIFDAGKGSVKEQLQMLLTNCNVGIKQNDILSRCLLCNGKTLKNLAVDEVYKICNEYQTSQAIQVNNKAYAKDYDEDEEFYDRFNSDSDCDEDSFQPMHKPVLKATCLTSKGVPVEISNVEQLSSSGKPAVLCELCGKLFWDEDECLKPVSELVLSITKLSI